MFIAISDSFIMFQDRDNYIAKFFIDSSTIEEILDRFRSEKILKVVTIKNNNVIILFQKSLIMYNYELNVTLFNFYDFRSIKKTSMTLLNGDLIIGGEHGFLGKYNL